MAARTVTRVRSLLPVALLLASAGAQAQDGIFDGSFEAGQANPVPGPLAFQNTAAQRLDQVLNSNYRFDALFTDFNNDGCADPFVFSHSDAGATSRLWLNRCDGSGTFVYADNATVQHHIPLPASTRISGWVSTLDHDGDGRQDLWGRDGYATGARYSNGSPSGSFMPYFVSKTAGCGDTYCVVGDITGTGSLQVIKWSRRVDSMNGTPVLPATGNSALPLVGDITGDGWPEVIQLANGGYWRNTAGSLSWQPVPAFTGGTKATMTLADFDGDGFLDIFAIDGNDDGGGGRAYLLRNNGSGGFTDVTSSAGLGGISYLGYWTGYGNTLAGDFDNDGRQDLLIAGVSYNPSVRLYRNNGNMTFTQAAVDMGASEGTGPGGYENGKARAGVADFDNDGRLDIVKTQLATNIGLWQNTTATNGSRWMKIRVRGAGQNTDAIGAHVRWYRPGTSQIIAHMAVQAGDQHPQTHLHTGLAGHTTVDVEVRFPSGGPVRRFNNVASNQEVIAYPNGCLIRNWLPGAGWPLIAPSGCSS